MTLIVYKNQVSGHGFWTKFFMVFSYTVFLNNMFLRYRGVFLVSRFHAKIVFFLFVGGHMPQTPA
jgi:hypothetical protein